MATRLERAEDMVLRRFLGRGTHYYGQGRNVWFVRVHSQTHGRYVQWKVYVIRVRGAMFAIDCTCPDRVHRGVVCKHMLAYELAESAGVIGVP